MRLLFSGIGVYVFLMLSILALCGISDAINLPQGITSAAVVCWCLWLFFFLPTYLLKRKVIKRLKELPIEELKNETFFYPTDYFDFIGPHDASVVLFHDLIERKDIQTLRIKWQSLSNRFRELETKAGHSGRPLIMDYFCWYDLNLKVLSERLQHPRT